MNKNLDSAISAVEMTYDEVIHLANDIVDELTNPVDIIIEAASNNVENMTTDALRDTLLKLALQTYSFASIKDKAAFKATLAETLRKEAYANALNMAEGTVAAKESKATLAISAEIVVEQIYELAADLLKTKLDECHRVASVLTTVITTRLSEAKLSQIDVQ